jgi:branched-chain amino acid transport system ATP-binding protein
MWSVPTLALKDLVVERGGRAVVRGVSLDIPEGEITALLGPNGAGKSSLVLAVGGMIRPAGGKVTLDTLELAGKRPEKIRSAGVAVVPEGRRLLRELTVEDNLRVATYALTNEEAREGREYAHELFPELDKRLEIRARSLSGGGDRAAADPDDPHGRRVGRRRASDRAVRDRRARARRAGLCDGPRQDPLLRRRQRAQGVA